MRFSGEWLLYVKWTVIWLVILPLLVWRFSDVKLFHSHTAFLLVAGFAVGLAVRFIDWLFYFIVRYSGKR
ncbi:hypothetical protein ACOIP5_003105 [Salmonella enterica]